MWVMTRMPSCPALLAIGADTHCHTRGSIAVSFRWIRPRFWRRAGSRRLIYASGQEDERVVKCVLLVRRHVATRLRPGCREIGGEQTHYIHYKSNSRKREKILLNQNYQDSDLEI